MHPKRLALLMGLAGIGVLWGTGAYALQDASTPLHDRFVTERWATVLVVLGFGLLMGSLAVLLQPPHQSDALLPLLFGTVWGALGAACIGGLLAGGLAVELGCWGAEVGLVGGAFFNRVSPKQAALFGLVYGMGAGMLVQLGLLLSLPENLIRIARHWPYLILMLMGSAFYGVPLGAIWGGIGGALWGWLANGRSERPPSR